MKIVIPLILFLFITVTAHATTNMYRIAWADPDFGYPWNHRTTSSPQFYTSYPPFYLFEGINFYADTGGTVPLYNGAVNLQSSWWDFISATNINELEMNFETCYIKSGGGGLAIKRWYNSSTKDHINTTWENLSSQGYVYEGILGYE